MNQHEKKKTTLFWGQFLCMFGKQWPQNTVLNLDGILMSLIEIPTKKGAEKVIFELASEGEKQ